MKITSSFVTDINEKPWTSIVDFEKFEQQVKLYEKDILDDGIEIGVEKQQYKTIKNCLKKRMKNDEIAELLDLNIEKVIEIILQIENEK